MCEDFFDPDASERTKFWMFITPMFAPEIYQVSGWTLERFCYLIGLDLVSAPSFLSHSVFETSDTLLLMRCYGVAIQTFEAFVAT